MDNEKENERDTERETGNMSGEADEAARGVVQIKDLFLGAQIATNASLEEWKSQPAQTEVRRADLVAATRAILNR